VTADAWAGVAVAALALAWAVTTTVLARMLKVERSRATIDVQLATLVRDVDRLVRDKDRTHAEMLGQMRDDRAVTDRRLRWLETHLWTKGRTGA
jgi:hypothetical protein